MQKILINDISFIDGSNRVPVISKARYWQGLGIKIAVVTTAAGSVAYRSQLNDVEILLIPNFKLTHGRVQLILEYMLRNVWALLKLRTALKGYTWIYSLSAVADNLIIPFVLKVLNHKFVWSVVFDNTVSMSRERNIHVRFLAYVFFLTSVALIKRADAIFAVNKSLEHFLVTHGIKAQKVIVTGNAVETDLILNTPEPATKAFDGLYIGRINEAKGAYDLLELTAIVRTSRPSFTLAIAGPYDAGVEKQFRNKIKELGISNNIILVGYVSGRKKFELLKSATMFVSLSHTESFGVAVLEAVCCGIPSVVYELPIYKELYVRDEVHMVAFKRADKAASMVEEILNNPKACKLSEPLVISWLNKYSWEEYARQEWERIDGI